jgi:hypothetical protein
VKQAVLKRLGLLEERHAAAINATRSQFDSDRAMEWLTSILRFFKTEPGPHESLMDALARCLGLRTFELRGLLMNPPEFRKLVQTSVERLLQARGTG